MIQRSGDGTSVSYASLLHEIWLTLKTIWGYAGRTPAWSIAILYFYVSFMGTLYSVLYFNFLNINVLEYYYIDDFILSGLQRPLIVIMPIAIMLLIAMVVFYVVWIIVLFGVRSTWARSPNVITIVVYLYLCIAVIVLSAGAVYHRAKLDSVFIRHLKQWSASSPEAKLGTIELFKVVYSNDENEIKKLLERTDDIRKMDVHFKADSKIKELNGSVNLGRTGRFLFILTPDDRKVHIIPLSGVIEIRKQVPLRPITSAAPPSDGRKRCAGRFLMPDTVLPGLWVRND